MAMASTITASVFADRLTLPAGAVWYRGSLYVAAPPDLLRFEDRDNDGIAEIREVVVTGWNCRRMPPACTVRSSAPTGTFT